MYASKIVQFCQSVVEHKVLPHVAECRVWEDKIRHEWLPGHVYRYVTQNKNAKEQSLDTQECDKMESYL